MKTKRVKLTLKNGEVIEGVEHTWENGETEYRDMCSNRINKDDVAGVE